MLPAPAFPALFPLAGARRAQTAGVKPANVPRKPPVPAPAKPKGVVLNRQIRDQLVQTATEIAAKYGIPREVFVAQIQQESGFNPTARGKAGEIGIAQIIPRYHPYVNPYDPVQSMDYLARFLVTTSRELAPRYGPDMALVAAVAAWNAGTPTVAAGEIPRITYDYVARIFGKDTADEFVRRAQGQTGTVRYALTQQTPTAIPVPQIDIPTDPRVQLILSGLLGLPPTIQQLAARKTQPTVIKPPRLNEAGLQAILELLTKNPALTPESTTPD